MNREVGTGAGPVRVAGYLPCFFVDTDFLYNGKMLMLSKVQRHDFFAVLSLKRGGWLDAPYPCMQALDALVAKMLDLGRKACQKLKQKLMELSLISERWQPLGWNAWQSAKGHKRRNGHSVRDIITAHEAQKQRREALSEAERQRRCRQRKKEDVTDVTKVRDACHEKNVTQGQKCHEENVASHNVNK